MTDLLTARPRVLVVDDEPLGRTLMDAVLRTENRYEVLTAAGGNAGLNAAHRLHPDLLVLDIGSAGHSGGYALCRMLKSEPHMRRMPVVLVTPPTASGADGKESGADEVLARPFSRTELLTRVRSLIRIKSLSDQLAEVDHVIHALSRLVDSREGSDAEAHTARVALFATALGREVGLGEDAVRIVGQAAMLRDLGKIGVPNRLLRKRGTLSDTERRRMQTHAALGEEIIAPLRATAALLPIIRHHHERWDGKGYPDGLAGEQIPLGARIVAVADSYAAMLASRPYRAAMTPAKALATLQAGAGRQWDSYLVELFVRWTQLSGPGLADFK